MSSHWVSTLQPYQGRTGFLNDLEARTKLISFIVFVLAVATTPLFHWWDLTLYSLVLWLLARCSRLSLRPIFWRSAALAPIIVGIALVTVVAARGYQGGNLIPRGLGFIFLVGRSWLALLAVGVLAASTPFDELVSGARRLGLPLILTSLLLLAYRYLFVLTEEVTRLNRAAQSRNFGLSAGASGGWRQILWRGEVVGWMIGSLFLRSFARGERVYAAMLSRGYRGQPKTWDDRPWRKNDVLFLLGFLALIVLIKL